MAGLWSSHFSAAAKSPEKLSPCETKGTRSEIFPFAEKPPSPAATPPSPSPGYSQPCLLCGTCSASCRLFTSSTPQNPNRRFYKCSALDHKFFKWADEVKPEEFIDVPRCGGCTAGVCRVRRDKFGPNAGRILFMCRVKEGEGSCGYRVWQDELQNSASGSGLADETITSSVSPSFNGSHATPTKNDLVKENKQSNGRSTGRAQRLSDEIVISLQSPSPPTISNNRTESPEIDTSRDVHCLGISSTNPEEHLKCQETQRNESSRRARGLSDVRITLFRSPTVDIEGKEIESLRVGTPENRPHKSPRRPHKRSRHGEVKAASCPSISSKSLILSPASSSVAVEPRWMVDAIRQNLSSQLQGWWGRLAFHPKPCLTTHASRSLDCCYVSSPRDSTLTVRDKILVLDPCHDTHLSEPNHFRVPLDSSSSSSGRPWPDPDIPNAMSKSISRAFTEAAEHLQNDFLSLLEEMDVGDYEAMSRASEATFAALDRLLFDYRVLEGRTKDYINCATSLADIEQSITGDETYQKLIERCSSERLRLDEINSVHAEAVHSVNRNKKRLKSLQEEVSSTMDWLFRIEAELRGCEAEMRNMEREVEKIGRNKEVLEEKYIIAANELGRLKRLLEEREWEHDVAKAAFERAKELLRG